MNQKHVLAIFHNSLGGGDSIVVNAKETTRGWEIEIQDSSSYDYVMPLDKIEDLSVESLERFVDGITMKDEASFVGGLVFGFLNANWPPDRKLDPRQRKEAAEFAEVESDDFPDLAERYCKRIADWAANHS